MLGEDHQDKTFATVSHCDAHIIERELLSVDFAMQGLDSLEQIIDRLPESSNQFVSLNLSDNEFEVMVPDRDALKPSNMEKLRNVVALNVLNNPKFNIQESILQVRELLPNLKKLEISLSEEADVRFILRNMKQLETLNGVKVELDLLNNQVDEQE
jgi:hypothetical protein